MSIIVDNLSKSFGAERIMDGFSYTFETGGRYCLFGASGSGKTTLFNIILGLVKPDSGRVMSDGSVTAVFQEDRLLQNQNALTNLKAFLPYVEPQAAAEALMAVGIEREDMDKPLSQWSGGMARRLCVVRAVLSQGDAILMDEPFKGLDEATKEKTVGFILDNQNGRTLVVATHEREDAKALSAVSVSVEQQKNCGIM